MLFLYLKHTHIEENISTNPQLRRDGTSITMMKMGISELNVSIGYRHYTTRLRREND